MQGLLPITSIGLGWLAVASQAGSTLTTFDQNVNNKTTFIKVFKAFFFTQCW